MNVDAFHHRGAEALGRNLIRHFLYPLHLPDFTGHLVMQRPDDTHYSRNLPYMVKRDVIVPFAIPSPRHVH
ncbi:hypothetical protein D3C81_1683210 [compost metagenome]